jgi:spore maturation protein CgeB
VPLEKDLDVCFYHGKSPERADLGVWLQALCAARGWSYVGGLVPGPLYAEGMGRARVVVNLNRNAETRAHRTFDAMACRACFLTSPQPRVSGEVRADGVHYLTWYGRDQLEALLDLMLRGNRWETFGNAGYELILTEHTWQIRAAQLYALLIEEFPHLQERIHARVH